MYSDLLQLQRFEWPEGQVELFVPDIAKLREAYYRQRQLMPGTPFPYWAQLWPAALAMTGFLQQHPYFILGKKVLELAAGLGLPSMVAAHYAHTVCCSDHQPEAVAVMQQSAGHNRLSNISCRVLDWNNLPAGLVADVLLLSDINYEPETFEQLYSVLQRFIMQGTMVLLSTPQRLMAKPFIERLLPWCKQQEEMVVNHALQPVAISLLVLSKFETANIHPL